MRRNSIFQRALFAIILAVMGSNTVSADWHQQWKRFWHNVGVGHHRNNAWPEPFVESDALQVIAPFEIMKRNGWRLHNTIGHELFRDSDGELLASGHGRVRWIATQSPVNRREIYVLRGRSQDETNARVASVRDALSRLYQTGPEPMVYITDIEPATASGAWGTQINRMWMEQLPAPKLPSTSAAGTSGSTQAGGGGGSQQ